MLRSDVSAAIIAALASASCASKDSLISESFPGNARNEIFVTTQKNPKIDLSNVAIYSGAGVSDRSKREIPESLKALFKTEFPELKVTLVGPEYFDYEENLKHTSLLIIPGGADKPYVGDLKGSRNERIASYLNEGGHLIAFCAGAYYLSKRVEFDMGGPLEVSGDRELALFPGIARGPVFGPYHYGSDEGGRVVELEISPTLKQTSNNAPEYARIYFDGGCEFVDADQFPEVTVLARYSRTPNKAAAMIEVPVGKGKAILCGAHPDITLKSSPLLSSNKESILNTLERHSSEREWLLRTALERLFTP
jgi:biotin--protein ligase